MVQDTIATIQYLESELENMGETSMPYYEPVGLGERYYRVSLATIKDGVISKEAFLNAFFDSTNNAEVPSVEEWKSEWHEILKYISVGMKNRVSDVKYIDELLDNGQYAVHHSQRYNDYYHPHYRVISKEIFEERLLPLINASSK